MMSKYLQSKTWKEFQAQVVQANAVTITLETKGFLKVHDDLPFNQGYVAEAPAGYEYGY
jgi:hypothetical protein